jgi:integrase/recombinase XerD
MAGLATFGFLKLSRALQERRIIKWSIRHQFRIAMDKKWSQCPTDYRSHVDAWLRENAARKLEDTTIYAMKNELQHLGFYLRRHNLRYLKLTYDDALTWMEQVNTSGLVPTGINRRLQNAKRFYAWLKARRIIEDSPFETFRFVPVKRKLPKILTEKEIVRLIRAAMPGRDRAVLEVLYASGCRNGGLSAIDLAKVSFEQKTAVTISKGGDEKVIYLNDSAIRAIRAYLPIREQQIKTAQINPPPAALFLRRGAARISTYAGVCIVKQAARRAKLGKHVHPHMIRHSFATHLLNRGADLYSIMQFLGHKSIESTVRYLQVATARLSEVHRRYHPRR